jgi:hypothetical protein
VDDVSNARHRPLQALWIVNRTGAQLDFEQMGCNEPMVAARPKQQDGG